MEKIVDANTATVEDEVLMSFARRAAGMTGADVEQVVRKAKRAARRARRPLTYADIEGMLARLRPQPGDDIRWRFAIHEAAHIVVALAFNLTTIEQITLSGNDGDPAMAASISGQDAATEDIMMSLIMVGLAGRAGEEIIFGKPSMYAGGGRRSDLSKVTELAYMLETSFGFGEKRRLVYQGQPDHVAAIAKDVDLQTRIHRRLELCYAATKELLCQHRGAVEHLAKELMEFVTLEGSQLDSVLKAVRKIMDLDLPQSAYKQ